MLRYFAAFVGAAGVSVLETIMCHHLYGVDASRRVLESWKLAS